MNGFYYIIDLKMTMRRVKEGEKKTINDLITQFNINDLITMGGG